MSFHDDLIKAEQRRREKAKAEAVEYQRKLIEKRESALRQWFESVDMSPHPQFTSKEPEQVRSYSGDGDVSYSTVVEMNWSVDGYEYHALWSSLGLSVFIHIGERIHQVDDKASIGRVLLDSRAGH